MTMRFLEGFGGYTAGSSHSFASGAELLMSFSGWNNTPTLTSLSSGSQGNRKYLTCTGTDPDMYLKLAGMDSTTVIVGFRCWWEGTGSQHIFRFQDNGLHMGSLGIISGGHVVYSTQSQQDFRTHPASTKPVAPFAWTYVEAKIYFNGSSGTIDYWIDGTAAGSYTSRDTLNQGTSCDEIRMGNDDAYSEWATDFRISDIYVDDATRHGPMDVWYQAADAAGSAANFTPSAGSNYQNVDEIGPDGDTTYNSSTATSTLDQIAHSDTLAVAPLVIQPMVNARYIPTGSANIKVGLLSSTTHDQASAEGLGDTYNGYKGSFYFNDPNTTSPWASAAAADAAETTYEHAA